MINQITYVLVHVDVNQMNVTATMKISMNNEDEMNLYIADWC